MGSTSGGSTLNYTQGKTPFERC